MSGRLVSAVDVANAALAEIGLPPTAFQNGPGLSIRQGVNFGYHRGLRLAYRAALLGLIAEHGPQHMVRCHNCSADGNRRGLPVCVSAGDALRGITCQREGS